MGWQQWRGAVGAGGPTWGMDTGAGRDQAARFLQAADALTDMRDQLAGTVAATHWQGPDADRFRTEWMGLAATTFAIVIAQLQREGHQLRAEADEQDAASAADAAASAAALRAMTGEAYGPELIDAFEFLTALAPGDVMHPSMATGPVPLRDPLGVARSELARAASEAIGWGFDTVMDGVADGLGAFGVRTDGIEQFHRDAAHMGEILGDWATGEQVPTIAQLGASGVVAAGSGAVAGIEAATGQDIPLLDDRPGGIISEVRTSRGGATAADLGDLVIANDALRIGGSGPLPAGQIGIQQIRPAAGGPSVFIVQVPPTEGAALTDLPAAYGGQGNSRDWGSNLRTVAGQKSAAMDDVRAAMAAAGVPAGADVVFVGHSQGGIIAAQLAADPGFNSASGADGTYNVTHSFSVGSPVQTVIPAQAGTDVVNVTHGAEQVKLGGLDVPVPPLPIGVPTPIPAGPVPIMLPVDVRYAGDPVGHLDLQGLRVDGTVLTAPNVHEVVVPGTAGFISDGRAPLETNHDSYRADLPDYGYYPSVVAATQTDPVLAALQRDLDGVYIGPGTEVVETTVVTVGRGEV